jgi:hypothetical protein
MDRANGGPRRAAIVGPGYIGAIHVEVVRRAGASVAIIVGRVGSDLAGRAAELRGYHPYWRAPHRPALMMPDAHASVGRRDTGRSPHEH